MSNQSDPAFDTRTPPQALDVEVAVLGAMLLDSAAAVECFGVLEPSDFFRPAHEKIFRAMYKLAERGQPIDMATVASELETTGDLKRCGGPNALIDIADSVFTAANAPAHARIIRDKSLLRSLIDYAHELAETARDDTGAAGTLIEQAMARLGNVRARAERRSSSLKAKGVCMSDVKAETIRWLWEPYIPVGMVSILEGDPGVGKTYTALQLVAILSRGWAFPNSQTGTTTGSQGPQVSIYLSAEDPLGTVIRPRLDRCGADPRLIYTIDGVTSGIGDDSIRPITMQDVEILEEEIERLHPAMVVIDPLQAFLGPNIDMIKAEQTRPVLQRIAALAERTETAFLIVRHLTKGGKDRAIYRGLGGIDIAGAARSILHAAFDPSDETQTQCVLAHVKTNLGMRGHSIGYKIGADGFTWTGPSNVSADDLNAPIVRKQRTDSRTQAAADWLEALLADGELSSNEIAARARRDGFEDPAIRAAKAALGVISERKRGAYFCRLPDNEAADPK